MTNHHYAITTEWTGNRGAGTANYHSYDRNHVVSAAGKCHEILGSSDPAFLGDKTRYNPEDLLLSALSACHMLWYLHLCTSNCIAVTDYVDHATGVMMVAGDGGGKFASVTLKPTVVIEDEGQISLANTLHAEANRLCFIANSCNFDVKHAPTITAK